MLKKIKDNIHWYIWATERRKELDYLQRKYSHLYHGVVFDIGGRDRGRFPKPKNRVKNWVFIDIVPEHKPDLVLDVANMKSVKNNSVDVINAIELFEHVEEVEKAFKECARVNKKNGLFFVSMPFLYQIHGDPYDFQRFTEHKIEELLKKHNYEIIHKHIIGRYFTSLVHHIKVLLKTLPAILKIPSYALFPILDCVKLLDKSAWCRKTILKQFHGGYFFIARKKA